MSDFFKHLTGRHDKSQELYTNLCSDVLAFKRELESAKSALDQRGKGDTYDGCRKVVTEIDATLATHTSRKLKKRLPGMGERLHRQMLLLDIALKAPVIVPDESLNLVHELRGTPSVREIGGRPIVSPNAGRNQLHELEGVPMSGLKTHQSPKMTASPATDHATLSPKSVRSLASMPQLNASDLSQTPNRMSNIESDSDTQSHHQPAAFAFDNRTISSGGTPSIMSSDRGSLLSRRVAARVSTITSTSSVDMIMRQLNKAGVNDETTETDRGTASRALISFAKKDKIKKGQIESIQALLRRFGADTDYRDSDEGCTPLIWSVRAGREDIIRVLLDNHASIEARDSRNRWTPLIWAICCGRPELMDLLIDRGAGLETTDGKHNRTPLSWAAQKGAIKAAESILNHHTQNETLAQSIDSKDRDGNTALSLACLKNHPLTAKAILRHGADPNLTVKDNQPLLILAIKAGLATIVHILIRRGANVQCVDSNGMPPLSLAVEQSVDMIKVLIDNGADIEARDLEGRTPLFWAIKKFRVGAVEVLIRNGAKRKATDNKGRTAQWWANRTLDKKIIGLVG